MDCLDVLLVVSVRRFPLVLGIWSTIVREAQAMPILVFIELIEQALVSSIKAVSTCCQSLQCPVIAHVWGENHETGIEGVGANRYPGQPQREHRGRTGYPGTGAQLYLHRGRRLSGTGSVSREQS